MLALVLTAATSDHAPSAPVGKWSYAVPIGPAPSVSIQNAGSAITVTDFSGDRGFTTTTSRYDAKTLELLSSEIHASCCGNVWTVFVSRKVAGVYDVITSHVAPIAGHARRTTVTRRSQLKLATAAVVNSVALLPWLFTTRHFSVIENLSTRPEAKDIVERHLLSAANDDDLQRPSAVPVADRALRVTQDKNDVTVIWYQPRTLIVDAYQHANAFAMREGL